MLKLSDKLYNWASLLDEGALRQAEMTARSPVVNRVAIMPDGHKGIGSLVGSVVATENAVIPSCVGVDIGCGMGAVKLRLDASDLPDSMDGYLSQATRDVPAGMGVGHDNATDYWINWIRNNPPPTKFSDKQWNRASKQFGSLGSGNHFYEVCLDEEDHVWIVLHSGSRGIGNELATIHIENARSIMKDAGVVLEDRDLAYLAQGTQPFQDYIADMLWSQEYAKENRQAMMTAALRGFFSWIGRDSSAIQKKIVNYPHGPIVLTVNCHHNYTTEEFHGGKKLWITRKGAISARPGQIGVIPGSMGASSFIVEGLGNPDSFMSCSHGAGRLMSRSQARREVDREAFRTAMSGRSWQNESLEALVDEAPMAYKPIEQVMSDQDDLVKINHTLHSVFNYKGVERGHRH